MTERTSRPSTPDTRESTESSSTGRSADTAGGKRQYDGRSVTLAVVTMDRLESVVETLLQLDLGAFGEVFVVDDSAGDDVREWCADRPVSYRRGPGENRQAARNIAIEECTTELLAFVDDDVLLPTDFADRVAAVFDAHPEAIAVGGPTLSLAVEGARNFCYRERMSVSPLTGTVHDDSYRWVPDAPKRVGLLKGANMCFVRSALEDIGGFDTQYGGPAQREETDVVVRLRRDGTVVYDPDLACFHKQTGGAAFGSDFIEWRFRNHGYFVRKNFGRLPFVLGFLSVFVRLCGNPESLLQLGFRRVALRQRFAIGACLWAYLEGGRRYRDSQRD
ncbi:MAG: glycosyltransferase [Halapricum sp.]